MKRCPKCNVNYSDNTLEFCLEDGMRLVSVSNYPTPGAAPNQTVPNKPAAPTDKTVQLPFAAGGGAAAPQNLEFQNVTNLQTTPPTEMLKVKAIERGNKLLEIAPLIISLSHNWWQWLYLNNQYYSSFSGYFLSANFLMWLFLLAAGAAVGLFALRRCQNKSFAITGLVVLAVNLLLFLVPKR